MIRFISGAEPYLLDRRKKTFFKGVDISGLDFTRTHEMGDDLVQFLTSYPLSGTIRAALVTVDDIECCNNECYQSLEECMPKEYLLLVIFRSGDARKGFYKALAKKGLIETYSKQDVRLTELVKAQAAALGCSFEDSALSEFLRRENYAANDDMSVYTVLSDVKRLSLHGEATITMDMVIQSVEDKVALTPFKIGSYIRGRDVTALIRQAELIKKSEAIPVLSALLREYRIAYKAKFFPLSDIGVTGAPFKYLSKAQLSANIQLVTTAIQKHKRGGICDLKETFLLLVAEEAKRGEIL